MTLPVVTSTCVSSVLLLAMAGLGALGGEVTRRWLGLLSYRRPGERSAPAPSCRWWVVPASMGVFVALTWRVLWWDPEVGGPATGMPHWVASATLLGTLIVVGGACVLLAAIDLDVHRLPDRIVGPTGVLLASGLGVTTVVLAQPEALIRAMISAVGSAVFYVALAVLSMTRGTPGLGLGDVKLSLVLGGVLGWFGYQSVLLGVYAGFLLGGTAALVLLVTRRVGLRGHLAYGPAMILGAFIAVLSPVDLLSGLF